VFGDGRAFWVNGKQIAHFDGDDTIELRITARRLTGSTCGSDRATT
jgi:hypothetical protein